MKVLQSADLQEFLSFISGIRNRFSEWSIATMTFKTPKKGNIYEVAAGLQAAFGDKEGVIFICNQHNLLTMSRTPSKSELMELSRALGEVAGHYDCVSKLDDVTPRSLGWINTEIRPEVELPTVMVIDDDDIVRELVSCAMGDKGRVVEVSNGSGITEVYKQVKPDVVFLDINMPVRDGWQILEEILRVDPKANIVMLSGNGTPENVVNARHSGAKSFISKPFTSNTIQNRFQHCMTARVQ